MSEENYLKFAGLGMEALDQMAQFAKRGDYFTASEVAAKLAKNLMDISRALTAEAIMEAQK